MEKEYIEGFFVGLIFGMLFIAIIFIAFIEADIGLDQEVADDVCKHLSNNSIAIAIWNGNNRLICEIPSFDSTTSIVIREAGSNN